MAKGFLRGLRNVGLALGLAMPFSLEARAEEPMTLEECIKSAQAARNHMDRESLVNLLSRISRIYLEKGDYQKSLSNAAEALNTMGDYLGQRGEEEGLSFRERYFGLFETGYMSAYKLGNMKDMYNFMESGKAGSLLESLGGRNSVYLDSIPEELRNAEKEAVSFESASKKEYNDAIGVGDIAVIRAARKKLDEALEKRGNIAEKVRTEAKKQANLFYPRPASLEETQSYLKDDEAMVLYGMGSAESVAMILYHGKATAHSLADEAELRDMTMDLQQRIADVQNPVLDKDVADLRAALIGPLNIGKNIRRVIISPSGELSYIPFSILMPEKEISYIQSGTTYGMLFEGSQKRGTGVLALGNPDYIDKKLSALPDTQEEIKAIGNVLLTRKEASIDSLVEALPKRERWRSVHLACHGIVDTTHPLLSSLALSASNRGDGFLSCLDIFRMNIPSDLAVLSACDTAKGEVIKGEGILGFTRAFMYAGASGVVCSLWKVDDAATKELMIKFYEQWNPKDGKNAIEAAAALKNAQEYIRTQEKWKHPHYWAPWQLWGISN